MSGETHNAHVVAYYRDVLERAARLTPTGRRPGQIVHGTAGRRYQVQEDGSWRVVDRGDR